jgi:2'-hydroxyisoflavone reductase
LVHRGQTQADTLSAAEHLTADRDQSLHMLTGREWDATVDTCAYVPRQVDSLAAALDADGNHRGGRHCFISTVSVYAEPAPHHLTEDGPVIELDDPTTEDVTGETYGGLKVLCERAVAQHYDEPLVIRPTYVVGPYDHTHRFTYWVMRMAEGGRVIAPDIPGYQIQVVDARDQARWICELLERGDHGTFHTVTPPPPFSFADMLDQIASAVAPAGTEIVPVDPGFLMDHDIDETAMPLWYPTRERDYGLSCDPARSVEHGFRWRPLAETVRETLDHERRTPTPNPDGAGWSREREAEVLAAWDSRTH